MGEEHQRHQDSDANKKSGLTQAQFLSWKTQKEAEALAKKDEAAKKREEDIAAGLVQMNGRELFKHQPWVFDNNIY